MENLIILSMFAAIQFVVWNLNFLMVMILVMMCSSLSLIINLLTNSPWISIVLFLMYVGGLLILMMMATYSISSNPSNLLKFKLLFFSSVLMIMITKTFMLQNETMVYFMFNSNIYVILLIILMLNITLMSASKMMFSPMKSMRSNKLKESL